MAMVYREESLDFQTKCSTAVFYYPRPCRTRLLFLNVVRFKPRAKRARTTTQQVAGDEMRLEDIGDMQSHARTGQVLGVVSRKEKGSGALAHKKASRVRLHCPSSTRIGERRATEGR
jgi:hypothetical protein